MKDIENFARRVEQRQRMKDFLEQDKFKKACLPLIKYLCENYHPHVTVIVTPVGAELLEGIKSTGEVMDFIQD